MKSNIEYIRRILAIILYKIFCLHLSYKKKRKIKIYRSVILPVVLYGYETWTLTLREKQRLKVFEKRVLRTFYGPKREKPNRGENWIMMNFTASILHRILLG
jgi:hypothetical protein